MSFMKIYFVSLCLQIAMIGHAMDFAPMKRSLDDGFYPPQKFYKVNSADNTQAFEELFEINAAKFKKIKKTDLDKYRLVEFKKIVSRYNYDNWQEKNKKGMTLFYRAVEMGNLAIVKYILNKDPDVINIKFRSTTPIYAAIQKNKFEVFKFLLANGADLAIPNNTNNLPIFFAIEKRKIDYAKLAIEKYPAIVNLENKHGYSALSTTLKEIRVLGNSNSNEDAKNENMLELRKFFVYLLEKGAQINNTQFCSEIFCYLDCKFFNELVENEEYKNAFFAKSDEMLNFFARTTFRPINRLDPESELEAQEKIGKLTILLNHLEKRQPLEIKVICEERGEYIIATEYIIAAEYDNFRSYKVSSEVFALFLQLLNIKPEKTKEEIRLLGKAINEAVPALIPELSSIIIEYTLEPDFSLVKAS